MRAACVLLALALLTATGIAPRVEANEPAKLRVVGGGDAPSSQLPWMAAIVTHQRNGGGEATRHFCGGSLVAPQVVLTAAHCLAGRDAGDLQVLLGRADLRATGGELIDIDRALTHPLHSSLRRSNDVALLHLASPSQQTPVALIDPGQAALWRPWQQATVAGWGSQVEGSLQSPTLRAAAIAILPDRPCSRRSAYGSGFVPTSMLCAGTPDGSADGCSGDSGGPLVVAADPARLVGVVSWGRGCGRAGTPGVYARLGDPSLNSWTRAATGALAAGQPAGGPPRTAVRRVGPGRVRPSFRLTAPGEQWAGFRCSLNGSRYRPCTGRVRPPSGKGVLRVRALDLFGQADPTPAVTGL